MDAPLVSIVVPCYNHGLYLERALNSIANQTYRHIEVIINDDCSPDNSVDVINRIIYDERWEIRFLEKTKFHAFAKNQGAHNSINFGIQQATGQIVSILNSDDTYHPQRIEKIVKTIQSQGAEFVFTGVRYIDADDRDITKLNPRATCYYQQQKRAVRFPSIGFACLTFNIGISTGNFAFTKSLYERVGAFKSYLHCHDWDFLLRCLIHTEPHFVPEALYAYRFHGTNSFESLRQEGINESAELLRNYFATANMNWSPNPIAPSRINWPDLFEQFIRWYNLSEFQESVS